MHQQPQLTKWYDTEILKQIWYHSCLTAMNKNIAKSCHRYFRKLDSIIKKPV